MNDNDLNIFSGIIENYKSISLYSLLVLQELLASEISDRQESFAKLSDEKIVGKGTEKKSHLSLVKG